MNCDVRPLHAVRIQPPGLPGTPTFGPWDTGGLTSQILLLLSNGSYV